MPRLLLSLLVVTMLFGICVTPVTADELTPKTYIEYFEPFQGAWKTTENSDGEDRTGVWVIRMAPTKMCLVTHGGNNVDGLFQSIDGYDPATKSWTTVGFDQTGSLNISTYKPLDLKKGARFGKGSISKSETTSFKGDGTTSKSSGTMTCMECSGDKIGLKWTEAVLDGKSMPDFTMTMERQEVNRQVLREFAKKQQETDGLAMQDHIKFAQPFVGTWKRTVESEGKATSGTWTGRVSPAKTCFITQTRESGKPTSQSIDGYDPVAKKWTVAAFDTDGGFTILKIAFDGMKKGEVFNKTITSIGEVKVSNPDGTTMTATSKMKCLECTDDRISYVLWDRKADGEEAPDQTITLDRQATKGKGGKR